MDEGENTENMSAADKYWEKKAEGYQRKKQGSVRMRMRFALDRRKDLCYEG